MSTARTAEFGLFAAQHAAKRRSLTRAVIADGYEQDYGLQRATAERVAEIVAAARDREQAGPDLGRAVRDALQAGEEWARDYVDSIRRAGRPAADLEEPADPIARHGDI